MSAAVGSRVWQTGNAYIPCIGLYVALIWGAGALGDNLRIAPVVPVVAALCLITAFTVTTVHQIGYWKNGVALFSHAREVWPGRDSKLEELYANALLIDGRVDEALETYKESCVLRPDNQYCHYWIAQIFFDDMTCATQFTSVKLPSH